MTASNVFKATVHESTADIDAAVWNSLAPSTGGKTDNPFTDHAFFLALEQSGCATKRTGWQPLHIVLHGKSGAAVGLMPLYLKSHSMGEYVFDHGWANAFQQAGGRYYPKLQCSVPFTPVTAPKLLVPSNDIDIERALLAAAQQLAEQQGASSVHATFLPADQADTMAADGWLKRLDTQFHWSNDGYTSFDDFLNSLASHKRKTIRRERRDALGGGITIRWLTGADLKEHHWDAFYAFYEDTGARKWGQPYLNREFFSRLNQTMAHSIVLMLAYEGVTPIAGAINFIGKDRIYGRNWGATRTVPFLHFELCYYQAIEYAIAHKLAVVEAGAQGDHKLARGYAPATTYSAHWIAHPGLRQAVAGFLDQERTAVVREQEILGHHTPFRKGERTDH